MTAHRLLRGLCLALLLALGADLAAAVPTADNGTLNVIEDITTAGTLVGNDSDGDTLTFSIVAQPAKGTIINFNAATGAFTYDPNSNENGGDTFTFKVSAGGQDSTTATVTVTITAVNDAPVIDNIADKNTNEDTALVVAFVVADVDGNSLTTSAVISNESTGNLITSAVVNNANSTVTITPGNNKNGTARITLTVNDGQGGSDSTFFTISVNAVADAPAISDIANQTINEDANTGDLAFAISDAETGANALQLAVTTSNAGLVPASAITFGGSNGSRTIRATPTANASGSATITVTITDGDGLTASDAFVLTVNPVNDRPTINGNNQIANQSTNEDIPKTVDFTVTDVETAVAALTVTATSGNQQLVANAGLTVQNLGGGARRLSIVPVPNANGQVTITVAVEDSGDPVGTLGNRLTQAASFTLTITAVNDPPTIADILDQIGVQNQQTSVVLAVADVDTALNQLTVTATSDNQALVRDRDLAVSGARDRLTIQPVTNAVTAVVGSAVITVSVRDQDGFISSDVFTFSVGNAAPDLAALVADSALIRVRQAGFRAFFTEDVLAATVDGADFLARISAAGVTTNVANGAVHPIFGTVTIVTARESDSVYRCTVSWTNADADGAVALAPGAAAGLVQDLQNLPSGVFANVVSAATSVDTTVPVVSSISLRDDLPPSTVQAVFQVVFSEDIDGSTVTSGDFLAVAVANSGSFGNLVVASTVLDPAARSVCTVTVTWNPQGALAGNLTLVTAGGFAVNDLAGNEGRTAFTASQALVIDANFPFDGRQAFTAQPAIEVEDGGRFEFSPTTLINRGNDRDFNTTFALVGFAVTANRAVLIPFAALVGGEQASFDRTTGRLVLPRVPASLATTGYIEFAMVNSTAVVNDLATLNAATLNAITSSKGGVQVILLKVTAGPGAGN